MEEKMRNHIALILYNFGMCCSVVGVIGSFVMGKIIPIISYSAYGSKIKETYNWGLVVAGIISSIILGFIFAGFSEIIELLQKNLDQSKRFEELVIDLNSRNSNITESEELPEL